MWNVDTVGVQLPWSAYPLWVSCGDLVGANVVWVSINSMAADTKAPLERAPDHVVGVIVTGPRDWGAYWRDAWLYGVLVGWECEDSHVHDDICGGDDALMEVAQMHGWNAATVARLREHRVAVAALVSRR